MSELDAGSINGLNPFALLNLRASETRSKDQAKKPEKNRFSTLLDGKPKDGGVLETERVAELAGKSEINVSALLESLHNAGDALKKRPLPNEIKEYKDAVRKFIRYVIDTSLRVDEKTGIRRINKSQKKFIAISVIDQKLEQLAAGVVTGQLDNLKRVSRIDEISGLVIDLLN
ncbi:MAG: DUF327 family protein [Spirochaetaceae bacterium]|nr:DUF327 family protein [Spirochaetaceae bacterium]